MMLRAQMMLRSPCSRVATTCGRMRVTTVASSLVGDKPPVSASPVGMAGTLYVKGGVKAEYEVPRELTTAEVEALPALFADSAEKAIKAAGFDGVELHAGNGYLLQSFLAKKTNQRADKYGGSIANRSRLLLEVIDAVAARVGAGRTSVKLQPGITFSDLVEPEADVRELLDYLGPELSKRNLAYVCLSSLNGEPYFRLMQMPAPNVSFDVFRHFRSIFSGTLMINGGLGIETGEQYVSEGVADLVSYGGLFIANANMPALVAAGVKTGGLNPAGYDPRNWYSKDPAGDAKNYTDWPVQEPAAAAK
ncbi:putative 12-oxophytodienoate reductase 12 [Tetrabaena socialis]|uniref:Putative 12-oxophytodienoate reductase 12 n=1 Tax=Tetrabaena socialis TaxID=47790 RepID=A0A2J8AHC2_9CHLO|nr:putative 12-oxophytodienoate reductase 12 [Tetrabaena socialis]|eukprot:PNH11896.1 putative 12-oxophytodienoate reductase 12 [Tetrabaena socialis]